MSLTWADVLSNPVWMVVATALGVGSLRRRFPWRPEKLASDDLKAAREKAAMALFETATATISLHGSLTIIFCAAELVSFETVHSKQFSIYVAGLWTFALSASKIYGYLTDPLPSAASNEDPPSSGGGTPPPK